MEKLGIIDLGSNTARLVLVNVLEGGYFYIFDESKESVRLSQDMERDGILKPQRIQQTITTLKMFKKLCDAYHVDKIIAVATAAVRRAKNQKSFLDEVVSACGIKLRVLAAEEEATYVYTGVINSMDVPKGIIMDIGGGSTKLIHYNRRNILHYETLPFGSVTLTDLFKYDNLSSEEQTNRIAEFAKEQFEKIEWLKEVEDDVRFIGVGGTFRNLGKMSRRIKKYPMELSHNYNVPEEDIQSIYDMVKGLDLDKKMKIKGLSSTRADIFQSALAVIKTFTEYMKFDRVTISCAGLREGIMFNTVVPSTVEKPITDVLGYSLNSLIRQYNLPREHVDQVCNLSVMLFKQLRVLHKFPRMYLKILKVAAMLYQSGKNIKYYNHHRNAGYIILNAGINALSHRDIVMSALVAASYRKDDVDASYWARFKDIITEQDFEIAKKLGVILKLADSLDRGMNRVIKGINCDVLGDSVIMKTEVSGDATLEIHDAISILPEFRRAFRKNIEIL